MDALIYAFEDLRYVIYTFYQQLVLVLKSNHFQIHLEFHKIQVISKPKDKGVLVFRTIFFFYKDG